MLNSQKALSQSVLNLHRKVVKMFSHKSLHYICSCIIKLLGYQYFILYVYCMCVVGSRGASNEYGQQWEDHMGQAQ